MPPIATNEALFDRHSALAVLPSAEVLHIETGAITPPGETADLLLTTRSRIGVAPVEGPAKRTMDFLHQGLLAGYSKEDRFHIISYLLAFIVSAVSGEQAAERFIFLQGAPGTGKSTFGKLLQHIVGEAGTTIAATKLITRLPPHREWLAGLHKYRLAVVRELPEKGALESTDLNSIVSGETISANFMRGNSFTFQPVCSVLIEGNSRPKIDSTSGLYRRLALIECNQVPDKPDLGLLDRLKTEAGQLLHLALRLHGTDWRHRLTSIPTCLQAAVEAYRAESNPMEAWLAECCNVDQGNFQLMELQSKLLASYNRYCEANGYKPMNASHFSRQLGNRLQDGKRKRRISTPEGRDYQRVGITLI